MKTQNAVSFSITSLLSQKDGKISGAMSPVLFMKEIGEQMGDKYNRLARVRFDDQEIFQVFEKGEGLTGYDTLIMGTQYDHDLYLTLWVDAGTKAVPVAMCLSSDKEVMITPIYEEAKFEKKLSEGEIKAIFNAIFDNPELIKIN